MFSLGRRPNGLVFLKSTALDRSKTVIGSSSLSLSLPLSPRLLRCLIHTPSETLHPVIDVSPLLETHPSPSSSPTSTTTATPPDRSTTISQIGHALQTRGYFYAQNVSILSPSYIQSIYDYSSRLHSLPPSVKSRFSYSGHGCYSGNDVGQPELAYEEGTVASVRAWDYSRTRFTLKGEETFENGDDEGSPSSLTKQQTINVYPDESIITPNYTSVLDDLYRRQDVLGCALMSAVAQSLDLPPHEFTDRCAGGDFGTIRLLYYPGLQSGAVDDATVGIAAHTDFEAFTLMHQNAPGLQFLPPSYHTKDVITDADWIDAPVRPGEFVVIVGDALERLTNGVLMATPHRVVRTAHPRWSLVRFNAFAAPTVLRPLDKFVSEERPVGYTAVEMKVHMETTMRNLQLGYGSWDGERQRSLSANYVYVDGKDPRSLE